MDVNRVETTPGDKEVDHLSKFLARRKHALATSYCASNQTITTLFDWRPWKPIVVGWKKLQDQFHKKHGQTN